MQQMPLALGLPPQPSMENFVVGANDLLCQALTGWLAGLDPSPAPMVWWGPTGSGKSHLLRAVAHALSQQGIQVGWLDAAQATHDGFDTRWGAVFMDDCHALSPHAQHAAFNWFVHAQDAMVKVMATSACPPVDLPLREDLRSRLAWGQVFALQPLTDAQRAQAVQARARALGLSLSEDVTRFMLNHFARDMVSLMALLEQLDRYAWQTQRVPTIPMLKAMLGST
jgi:DnaA family protein